ncbi:DENN domain-containing protein [Sodiomyces alkalinus F11]|uniref:DENN domain-containing protein n=1 Tax=Sodiomyces alkalinus (strain CBS 110278 / VKM F-3762 / F11) TaxID=1314773 RepID=A0A3N2Q9H6_SODAK|nr:DENN domain-containing protein [Sodiomyces alkalinus F11]ROT43411.1 DENN domain-containing protein [Sodiomyces alkalinus F11]
MDDSSTTPLADYFWIAGVETISYDDFPPPNSDLEATIAEDGESEGSAFGLNGTSGTSGTNSTNGTNGTAKHSARHSRQNSANMFSSSRFSTQTLEETDGNTMSNRSSVTIRPSQASNNNNNNNSSNTVDGANMNTNSGSGTDKALGGPLDGFDFDSALFKFAAEREHFLEDLTFSAGAKVQSRPPMVNPRTERIKAEESEPSGRMSPLRNLERSIKGSIRRKISFRDMNSMRRQPATGRSSTPGGGSIRTSKRLSNYNSVIPPPEPLNTDPDMHPLKRRFEPVLLDRYPTRDASDEVSRRGRFPDYVPMFAFPNDIQIVSSDERPRSTWHGFTMTSDDNSKIYGITVIVWNALASDVADEVEKRCEQWRQRHMSNEERELAASLGVRLAAERAHLSQLLAKLPTAPSGSQARDRLDDQISTVEEKISLMTEMLRPLRHGAASKIDGLTAGETGLWIPRAYGILGRDPTRMTFWKEWLRAVIVPMTDGGVLRIPPSSPKVGRWQPLERYVVNLCTEAFSPLGSKTQVEIGVRELRLYARKEAANEIPGTRTIDLYALFRCLSLDNMMTLFEAALAESRIIFLSSHTGMLHLACHALVTLLYPLKWASIFIPVLPARLLSALEAPCPYIIGIERRYERIELPDDDYVLVDLDKDTIDALRYGVATGPPPYAIESFPYDAFSAENASIHVPNVSSSTLAKWVTQSSSTFGEPTPPSETRPPVFNAFMHSKVDPNKPDRPGTSKSTKTSPPSSVSPVSMHFPPMPSTPVSRSDSGFALSTTLREKRSGYFNENGRRSSSFGLERHGPIHRPSLPFLNGHAANMSISAISVDSQSSFGAGVGTGAGAGGVSYAPSMYAQSTLAASTIMPNMLIQPVHNTDTTIWVEGHCFNWLANDASSFCTICDERSEGDGIYKKYLGRPSKEQKNNGRIYSFDMAAFIKSLPYDQQEYAAMLRETQAFNEFIHERETKPGSHPSVRLFDEILMAKRARGRPGITSGLSRLSTIRSSHGAPSSASGFAPPSRGRVPSYLSDTSDHLWRTASVPVPSAKFTGDYRSIVTRIPSKLDTTFIREPRIVQGVPRPEQRGTRGLVRKQVPSMIGTSPTE